MTINNNANSNRAVITVCLLCKQCIMPLPVRDAGESPSLVFVTNVNAAITTICAKTVSGEDELPEIIRMIMTLKSTPSS